MKLAIMQPYFFPYIGYFQAIKAVDKYIVYDKVNFVKKSWIYRNRLLEINKTPFYFSPELKDKSHIKKISEIELSDNQSWRKKILNKIYFNYKKAEYFEEINCLLESIIHSQTDKLSELNFKSITTLCDYLEIKTLISNDNDKYAELEDTLQVSFGTTLSNLTEQMTIRDKKIARILDICKSEKATTYVNAIGGKELYPKKPFVESGIELLFIRTNPYAYKQSSSIFYPDLSIIDVIMHNGKEKTKHLLNNYKLV
jgi:hypothetical protein